MVLQTTKELKPYKFYAGQNVERRSLGKLKRLLHRQEQLINLCETIQLTAGSPCIHQIIGSTIITYKNMAKFSANFNPHSLC